MIKIFLFMACFVFSFGESFGADALNEKKHYVLANDPIDVVIVSHPKDVDTLDLCIEGIRRNGDHVGRVIVVSPQKLTEQAEWVDEKIFPFTKEDVALAIAKGDKEKSERVLKHPTRGAGWYLQQLLKMYSPLVISGISSN
ncbi:MAG: hypothetical protein K2X97_09735, partial [Mycobacteriaceae bacterium]|nr:hypothetical protein [Mycobacteriaceae bacterium]